MYLKLVQRVQPPNSEDFTHQEVTIFEAERVTWEPEDDAVVDDWLDDNDSQFGPWMFIGKFPKDRPKNNCVSVHLAGGPSWIIVNLTEVEGYILGNDGKTIDRLR